ncbi:hypothetical protein D9M71_521410 [compost metagenome]
MRLPKAYQAVLHATWIAGSSSREPASADTPGATRPVTTHRLAERCLPEGSSMLRVLLVEPYLGKVGWPGRRHGSRCFEDRAQGKLYQPRLSGGWRTPRARVLYCQGRHAERSFAPDYDCQGARDMRASDASRGRGARSCSAKGDAAFLGGRAIGSARRHQLDRQPRYHGYLFGQAALDRRLCDPVFRAGEPKFVTMLALLRASLRACLQN